LIFVDLYWHNLPVRDVDLAGAHKDARRHPKTVAVRVYDNVGGKDTRYVIVSAVQAVKHALTITILHWNVCCYILKCMQSCKMMMLLHVVC